MPHDQWGSLLHFSEIQAGADPDQIFGGALFKKLSYLFKQKFFLTYRIPLYLFITYSSLNNVIYSIYEKR